MSYLKAESVLPQELIEIIQQYVGGTEIYIPSAEKQAWGSRTDTKRYLQERNLQIYDKFQMGFTAAELAEEYSLSEKSIQRIIRKIRTQEPKDQKEY